MSEPDVKEEDVQKEEQVSAKSIEDLIELKSKIVNILVKLTNWAPNDVEYLLYSGIGSILLFFGLMAAKFG